MQVNKPLYTCTSWYAYAAMFSSSQHTRLQLTTDIDTYKNITWEDSQLDIRKSGRQIAHCFKILPPLGIMTSHNQSRSSGNNLFLQLLFNLAVIFNSCRTFLTCIHRFADWPHCLRYFCSSPCHHSFL